MRILSNSDLSSVKKILIGKPPFLGDESYLIIGEEIHSRILEDKVLKVLDDETEKMIDQVQLVVNADKRFKQFMKGAKTEQFISKKIKGLMFRGSLDILNWRQRVVVDLKTTSVQTENAFIKKAYEYDYFRQATMYLTLTGLKRFMFMGLMKKPPYNVFWLDTRDYPAEMKEAKHEMDFLIHFIKKHPEIIDNVKPNSKYAD